MMSMYKSNMKVKQLGQGYRRAQISQSLRSFTGHRFPPFFTHYTFFCLPIWSPEDIGVPQTFALHSTFYPVFENYCSFIHG